MSGKAFSKCPRCKHVYDGETDSGTVWVMKCKKCRATFCDKCATSRLKLALCPKCGRWVSTEETVGRLKNPNPGFFERLFGDD